MRIDFAQREPAFAQVARYRPLGTRSFVGGYLRRRDLQLTPRTTRGHARTCRDVLGDLLLRKRIQTPRTNLRPHCARYDMRQFFAVVYLNTTPSTCNFPLRTDLEMPLHGVGKNHLRTPTTT